MMDYHLLPQFRPARLQDLVLWYEPWSFRGRTWRNLAPCYADRNHGTAHGGVGLSTWHPQFPPAPTFYGEDDYVDCGKDDSLDFGTDDFSVELWFKANSLEGAQTLIGTMINSSPYKGWFITNYSENTIKFHVNGEDGGCPAEIDFSDTANLHHIVGVRISTGVSLYLDGVLKKTTSCAIGNVPFLDVLLIGARPKPVSTLFNGTIPIARIYKAALTPAEIMHNYTHHPLYLLQRGINPYMFIKRGGIYYVM